MKHTIHINHLAAHHLDKSLNINDLYLFGVLIHIMGQPDTEKLLIGKTVWTRIDWSDTLREAPLLSAKSSKSTLKRKIQRLIDKGMLRKLLTGTSGSEKTYLSFGEKGYLYLGIDPDKTIDYSVSDDMEDDDDDIFEKEEFEEEEEDNYTTGNQQIDKDLFLNWTSPKHDFTRPNNNGAGLKVNGATKNGLELFAPDITIINPSSYKLSTSKQLICSDYRTKSNICSDNRSNTSICSDSISESKSHCISDLYKYKSSRLKSNFDEICNTSVGASNKKKKVNGNIFYKILAERKSNEYEDWVHQLFPRGVDVLVPEDVTQDAVKMAAHFTKWLPDDKIEKLTAKELYKWAQTFDMCVKIDGYTITAIYSICKWARNDDFWSTNFYSPLKLRRKDKDGVRYIDAFDIKLTKIAERKSRLVYVTGGDD